MDRPLARPASSEAHPMTFLAWLASLVAFVVVFNVVCALGQRWVDRAGV